MRRGFPLSEVDGWDTGMLLNFCYEHDSMIRRQNGEIVHDNMERYRIVKSLEPEMERRYKDGTLKEAKYRQYKELLAKAEKMLGGDG